MDPNNQPSTPEQNPESTPTPTPESTPSFEPTPAPEAPVAPEFAPVPEQPSAPSDQPITTESPAPTPTEPGTPPAHDPGKVLGIVGIILAFFGTQVIGLILSIVGYTKSKKVGIKNNVALAGIIVNSIMIALAIILIPIVFGATLASFTAISDQAQTTLEEAQEEAAEGITGEATTESAAAAARTTVLATESFRSKNPAYPMNFSEVTFTGDAPTLSPTALTSAPEDAATIEFYSCGGFGNKIGYWNYETSMVEYDYSGAATGMEGCVLVAS